MNEPKQTIEVDGQRMVLIEKQHFAPAHLREMYAYKATKRNAGFHVEHYRFGPGSRFQEHRIDVYEPKDNQEGAE